MNCGVKYELWIVKYELWIVKHELRIMNYYELWNVKYEVIAGLSWHVVFFQLAPRL